MNNNFKSVFGFTIGPIYEMMGHSQKTRELWFSSFFFSWYVKELYRKLSAENVEGEKCFHFLTPFIEDVDKLRKTKAGLFPDHIIAQSKKSADETYTLVKEKIELVNTEFINIIDAIDKEKYLPGKKREDVEKIFKDYIQTSFLVLPADKLPDDKKIVETIDTYLDALERNRSFSLGKNKSTCYRCKSLPSVFHHTINETLASGKQKQKDEQLCPFCFVKYWAHHSDAVCSVTDLTKERPFPSVGEISACELKNKYPLIFEKLKSGELEDLNRNDFKKDKNAKSDLMPYHKYMAIVQADGDRLGDTANKAKNPKELSKILFDFGKDAHDIIKKFHGEPIYIGGDDVLLFMPTAYYEGDNFFTVIDCLKELSNAYKCKMNEKNLPGSISFGVNLFYYKSPLSLAIKEAREQLNYFAKKIPGKDSLALLLTQHSGQKTALRFRICSHELDLFNTIMKNIRSGEAEFPHGIHHKLALYRKVLINLSRIEQIEHFFNNRFNEEIHESLFKKGLPELQKLLTDMLTVSTASGTVLLKGEEANKRLNEFLSMIRFIKFLIGEDK
jgi:CRISPR-associated protein Cmr2